MKVKDGPFLPTSKSTRSLKRDPQTSEKKPITTLVDPQHRVYEGYIVLEWLKHFSFTIYCRFIH